MISQTNDNVDRLEVSTNENTEEGEGIGSLIEEGNSEIIQVKGCGDSFQPMIMESFVC